MHLQHATAGGTPMAPIETVTNDQWINLSTVSDSWHSRTRMRATGGQHQSLLGADHVAWAQP
jgi:hypothetical protein